MKAETEAVSAARVRARARVETEAVSAARVRATARVRVS